MLIAGALDREENSEQVLYRLGSRMIRRLTQSPGRPEQREAVPRLIRSQVDARPGT